MADVKTMQAADLVAHLHPTDRPSREHTLAAVTQIRELMRYLAAMAVPHTSSKAFPAPNVVSDVALVLRDAMPDLAALFGSLAARTDQFSDSPDLYTYKDNAPEGGAAAYVEQAAIKLLEVASTVDVLKSELDAAGEAGTMFNLRAGA